MKRPIMLMLVAVAAIAAVQRGYAADLLSGDYGKCMDAASSNFDFANCAGAEVKRQEGALNAAWKIVSQRMKERAPKSFEALLAEERLWVKWKDEACRFYTTGDFGREGQVLHFGACKAEVVAERAQFLKQLADFLAQ